MNKVVLTGRLTRDPEIKYAGQNGDFCIANYTLAVDREFAKEDDEQDADFIRCKALGKRGEFAEKYFCKGMKIGVSGRIETGSYEDKEGRKVYTTDVVVDQQEFEERKAVNDSLRNEAGTGGSVNGGAAITEDEDGFMKVPDGIDEELPFV